MLNGRWIAVPTSFGRHCWLVIIAFLLALALVDCSPTLTPTPVPKPTPMPTPTLTPLPEAPLTRIAFVSNRDGNYEIYTMAPDGSDQTRLTDTPDEEFTPVWSPDGRWLAFAYGGSRLEREILVMRSDGSERRQLTRNLAYDITPVWSPDGSRVAFASDRAEGVWAVYTSGIEVVPLGEEGGVQVYSPPAEEAAGGMNVAAWLPDGRIVFVSFDDAAAGNMFTMQSDGTNLVPFTVRPPEMIVHPAWSPDGSQIAYVGVHDDEGEIYVMKADGTNARRLTQNPSPGRLAAGALYVGYPAWSPDGEKIAFMSLQDGNQEIYVINADGSDLTRLTDNPAVDTQPSWGRVSR
ncbi:MAG: TolB family protein [Anaerolineae bacterium]